VGQRAVSAAEPFVSAPEWEGRLNLFICTIKSNSEARGQGEQSEERVAYGNQNIMQAKADKSDILEVWRISGMRNYYRVLEQSACRHAREMD
jgi:hypothetical protein